MDDQKRKKRILYLSIAGFIILLLLVLVSTNKKNDIDVLPEEVSSINYSDKAVIKNSKLLLPSLGSTVRYELLAKDLYYYGKNSYDSYKKDKAVIGFEVTSDIKKNGDSLSFEGHFGANNNKILVVVKKLNNLRLYTTITNNKTEKNLDTSLPSNNKRNQFIATLPIAKDNFSISYDSSTDSFTLNLHEGTSAVLDKAGEYLASSIGVKDISHENVNFIRSNDITSQNTVVPSQESEDD